MPNAQGAQRDLVRRVKVTLCTLADESDASPETRFEAVRSCVLPLSAINDTSEIVTLEGLGAPNDLHPLQRAFIQEQAAQCGYCINGMIMSAAALLDKNKYPSETEIREALAGNLCRCGTHQRIVAAIQRAAVA